MFKITLFSICFLLFASDALAGGWGLDTKSSAVTFVSIKKSSVAEVHHFEHLRGAVDDHGQVRIEIALASVETYIPIRNSRMKDLLFEVARFPKASISAKLDPRQLTDLKVGQRVVFSTVLALELHGKRHDISGDVSLVKLADGSLMASSANPIIVNASDFDLVDGIERLRDVAKLPRIATAVPVTFRLTFIPVQ